MCQFLAGIYVEAADKREVFLSNNGVNHARCPVTIDSLVIHGYRWGREFEYFPETEEIFFGEYPEGSTPCWDNLAEIENFIERQIELQWPIAVRRTWEPAFIAETLFYAPWKPLVEALKRIEVDSEPEFVDRWHKWPKRVAEVLSSVNTTQIHKFNDVLREAYGDNWPVELLHQLDQPGLDRPNRYEPTLRVINTRPLVIVWHFAQERSFVTIDDESYRL